MSDPSTPEMQFTKAEYADPAAVAATCLQCQQAISGPYFEVNGQTVCSTCAEQIQQARGAGPGLRGLIAATGAGIAAGIAGAILYYGVLALTGYEFGLIAVVVGFMVGRAVHWGSSGWGGFKYQALAVALTYLAIVSCYVPAIVQGLQQASQQQEKAAAVEPAAPTAPGVPPTASQVAMFFGVFALIVLASPFLAGFENIIGWLIIGFALFEAWKINRSVEVTVTGPYEVAPAQST